MVRVVSVGCGILGIVGLAFALLCGNGSVDFSVLVGVAAILFFVYWFLGRREYKYYPVFLFLGTFALCNIIIFVVQNPQVSDFQTQLESARSFMEGNWTAYHTPFYEIWPDQISYSLIEVLLLSICNKIAFVKIFEAACTAGIAVITYFCIREEFSQKTAQYSSAVLALFPTISFAVGSANNQMLSALLCMVALYLFVFARHRMESRKKLIVCYAICGLIVAVARFVRPDAVLVVVAMLIVIIFVSRGKDADLKGRRRANVIWKGFSALSLVAAYFIIGSIITLSLGAVGIMSPEATGDRVIVNKLVMGTNSETSGAWSSDYIDRIEEKAENEGKSYQEAAMGIVVEQVSPPNSVSALLIKKAQSLWWGSSLSFNLIEADPAVANWLAKFDKGIVFFLISLSMVSLWARSRTRSEDFVDNTFLVYSLILVMTILAYCILEVQPRYLYFGYIIMFIMAADGIRYIKARISEVTSVQGRHSRCSLM